VTGFEECIIYAWASFRPEKIGSHALPSSYDVYDREFGWTADDFDSASGGTLVNFYTLGIAMHSLNTGKDRELGLRLDDVPHGEVEGRTDRLMQPGDWAYFQRSGDQLYDVGAYGVYETLCNRKIPLPNQSIDIRIPVGIALQHLEPATFTLDGKVYTIDNKKRGDSCLLESSRIVDDQGKVLIAGDWFKRYIVAAIGFPEQFLSKP
jgi:hypothetical protein